MKLPKIGRNEPCWCLSGKKHKECHLGQTPIGSVILVVGEPGTGKTTLRDQLNQRLGSFFFSLDYDDQLKKLIDAKGEIKTETFREAQNQIISGVNAAAKKCAVIADCLFSEQRLGEFKQELSVSGHRPFFILLHCDEQLR